MPIPIAKEQEQFRAPTAATPSGNAGKVLPVNTGMTEATENITKAAFTVNDVLAKLRISNEQAKATNDFLAYKKQMNDLLYSNELDENGNPIGFIYKKGENAYNSLKEYDAKASAFYQNFTKKLSNYLPVASEAAFKSANDYNESFRSMLMRHSSEQNLAFKQDAVVNYAADKKASVSQDLIAALSKEGKIDDKLINFTDMSLTDMDSMIMEYFVNTAGMPTAGIQMSKKENADLLKIILSQAAVELYDKDHMFGGYQHCQALLDKLKQDSVEGKGLLPTEKVFEVGRNFTLDQFETAFRHPNFDREIFYEELDKSEWLYPVDKIKYKAEYEERERKASNTGYGNSFEAQSNFLYYVANSQEVNTGETDTGYQRGDLGYLYSFLPALARGQYNVSSSTSVNPNTLEPSKNKEGKTIYTYSTIFNNKELMNKYNEMGDTGRKLIDTFALHYAGIKLSENDITWTPPSEKEIYNLITLADKLNSPDDGNERKFIEKEQLKDAINGASKIAKDSSPQIEVYKDKNGEISTSAYLKDNQFIQMFSNLLNYKSQLSGNSVLDGKEKTDLYVSQLKSISQIDASQIKNGRVNINKGFIGNIFGLPEAYRKAKERLEIGSDFLKSERAKQRSKSIIGKMKNAASFMYGAFLYDEYDPETASEEMTDKFIAYNERAEQAKRYDKQFIEGERVVVSRRLVNASLDICKEIAESGGLGLLTGYATVDEKGIENSNAKQSFTRFAGQLTLEDWNKIDFEYLSDLFIKNGWDVNKFDSYMRNIDEHAPQYIEDYRQYIAGWIIKNKPYQIETSSDGINWVKQQGDLPFSYMSKYSTFGSVKHVSLYPTASVELGNVSKESIINSLSDEEYKQYLETTSGFGVPYKPSPFYGPSLEKTHIVSTNKNTYKYLQEKREKDAVKAIYDINKATLYSSRGRKK